MAAPATKFALPSENVTQEVTSAESGALPTSDIGKAEGGAAATVSPLLDWPNATAFLEAEPGAFPEYEGVAWHYGDPLTEQRAFEMDSTFGIVDRSNRVVLEVAGEEAPEFLHRLLSQHLSVPEEGLGTWALNLDANGRILHHIGITYSAGTFYLDVSPRSAYSLQRYLEQMVFWSKVTITRSSLSMLSIIGAGVKSLDHAGIGAGLAVAELAGAAALREYELAGLPCTDLLVADPLASAEALIDEGGKLAGLMAYTALRVRGLVPEVGIDMDEKSIPHESSLLVQSAVHLNKGCYRGQETVARVDNLGRSPRVLALAHFDGSAPELPTTGAVITKGGRSVGRVGTVVHDYEYGPIGLVLVKRSAAQAQGLVCGDAALQIDQDSLPAEPTEQAGRDAVNKFLGKSR